MTTAADNLLERMGAARLPASWSAWCAEEFRREYFRRLLEFLSEEREREVVYPPVEKTFAALEATPFSDVRVLLLGQDPYHDQGQAHGLCFSVPPGVPPPPSLVNVFRELRDDVGCPPSEHGCLLPWANQGVLLLNTVLTVRAHQAHSHRGRGWEKFTDAVIRRVATKANRVVFVLWGRPAQKKIPLIDERRHAIVQSAHPSPLSARRGFFGSRPFSHVNRLLIESGQEPVDWDLSSSSW